MCIKASKFNACAYVKDNTVCTEKAKENTRQP
jgi:hypothetical protein